MVEGRMATSGAVAERPQANRRRELLDSAARAFSKRGYDGTSIRDIAADVGVQPSSLYYFFRAKDDLFEAVYEQGVLDIMASVEAAVVGARTPWSCLERAAVAHLQSLLSSADYSAVVASIIPRSDSGLDKRLIRHRDQYEMLFIDLIEALPLPPKTDRRVLRLAILSVLNSVPNWYRPNGDTPKAIAKKIIGMFRRQLDIGTGG